MIEIKLSFTSVDEAIAYLRGKNTEPAALTFPPVDAPAPKVEKPKATKPAAPVVEPSEPAAAPAPAVSSSAPAPSVDYPTLQKAVFALAGKSRDAAAAVAASFGVKNFKELDPAKWAEALAAVQAKTAEL